jgi:3-dehydroquinate synthase
MIIKSSLKEYEVSFSTHFSFVQQIESTENRFVIIDAKVNKLYGKYFNQIMAGPGMVFHSIERNKTVRKALEVAEAIMALPSKRNTTLISIGGGIVQDVTGFAASILYRGIKWIFVPTTLLAQTDSCIGSKTSLNHSGNKNLLGTFFPPNKIFIDVGFVSTLSKKDFLNGAGEIAKIAITRGEHGIGEIEQDLSLLLKKDAGKVLEWVQKSLEVKKKYVEEDEFDVGKRKLLNFGHTFGHALEKSSRYAVPHGQAVSIGMLIANNISEARGKISPEMNRRLQKIILPLITTKIRSDYFTDGYYDAIKKDKKRQGDSLPAILLCSDTNGYHLAEIHDLLETEIKCAVKTTVTLLREYPLRRQT